MRRLHSENDTRKKVGSSYLVLLGDSALEQQSLEGNDSANLQRPQLVLVSGEEAIHPREEGFIVLANCDVTGLSADIDNPPPNLHDAISRSGHAPNAPIGRC